jgi:hypothetical protein
MHRMLGLAVYLPLSFCIEFSLSSSIVFLHLDPTSNTYTK